MLRWFLAALLAFGALNAFVGGFYGLRGARGVPVQWLASSPFEDYFVPSFVLFVAVGGSLLVAAAAVWARAEFARRAVLFAGGVVLVWIALQVAVIGYVSWLQPVTAIAGIVTLALGSLLPRSLAPRRGAFFGYYRGVFCRPRATFDALMLDPRRLRLGTRALLSNAALYTLVYLFLVIGHGRPTVFKPWLAIDAEIYYRYDAFLLAPSMIMAWLLAACVVQLLARQIGRGVGSFEDTLSSFGFAIAAGSWPTLLHDLLTSGLGAFRVIDQRRYEDAMSSATPFRTLIWVLMIGYAIAFLVLFTKAIGSAQRVRTGAAALLAAAALLVYQGVFVLFNR